MEQNEFMKFMADNFSTSTCLWIIIIAWIISMVCIFVFKWKGQLQHQKRIVEYFPSVLSSLGVLGTFLGITIGLSGFDTNSLNESIPILLDGLKTAFYTSLVGMITSLITNLIINKIYDSYEAGLPSNEDEATSRICSSIEKLSVDIINNAQNQTVFFNSLSTQFVNIAAILNEMKNGSNTLVQMSTAQAVSQQSLETILKEINTKADILNENTDKISQIVSTQKSMELLVKEIKNVENGIGANLNELLTHSEAQASISQELLELNKNFSIIMRGYVDDIESKMNETNKLLAGKFDEFSELLKKSNTEALVQVMKKVTIEFEKQMTSLINKLIQENFEELNRSVERLNQWQQENKEMISSLTKQYKEMEQDFETTGNTLTNVAQQTQSLTADSGKLSILIEQLNKVMIDDTKFVEISGKLERSATLTQTNIEKQEEYTNHLNDWVRKQRSFVDGVMTLIEKLDELNKQRDFNDEFWKDTRKKMEEGVGIIAQGTETLNGQLRNIDQQFYERLGATLANLDACIQAMVENQNRLPY